MVHSFQRWSRITATTETICTTILNLPSSLASMVKPSDAAMDRKPLTKNSRPITTTAIHAGTRLGFNWTRVTNAAAIRSLSASGSIRIPMVVICPRLRARYPSMPSVMEAAMKIAEASNSFSPVTLLKRALERIQISRGMLKIRISVMELGRFTLRGGSGVSVQTIILHARRERNGRKGVVARGDADAPSAPGRGVRGSTVQHLFRCGRRCGCFHLLGDNLILDLVVGRLRNDLLLHQFVLGPVGAAVDDLL